MQRSLKMLMLSLIFAAACENEIMRKRSTIIYPSIQTGAANLLCDLQIMYGILRKRNELSGFVTDFGAQIFFAFAMGFEHAGAERTTATPPSATGRRWPPAATFRPTPTAAAAGAATAIGEVQARRRLSARC